MRRGTRTAGEAKEESEGEVSTTAEQNEEARRINEDVQRDNGMLPSSDRSVVFVPRKIPDSALESAACEIVRKLGGPCSHCGLKGGPCGAAKTVIFVFRKHIGGGE